MKNLQSMLPDKLILPQIIAEIFLFSSFAPIEVVKLKINNINLEFTFRPLPSTLYESYWGFVMAMFISSFLVIIFLYFSIKIKQKEEKE